MEFGQESLRFCRPASKKTRMGRPPKPLEDPDLTDQAFKIRTDPILKEILLFLDKPENQG